MVFIRRLLVGRDGVCGMGWTELACLQQMATLVCVQYVQGRGPGVFGREAIVYESTVTREGCAGERIHDHRVSVRCIVRFFCLVSAMGCAIL